MIGTVLVTGASGFLGGHVARDLARAGYRVVATSRDLARLAPLAAEGIAVVAADVVDRASLERAVTGVTHVVHLAGAADSSDRALNVSANVGGTANLAAAVRAVAPRARVVFASSHCAVRALRDAYGESKLQAEQALAESGVERVVLRPAMIYGEGSAEFGTFVRAVRRWPVVPILGTGRTTIRPVFVDDVLPAIRAALVAPEARGGTYELCGPEPVSFDALVRHVAHHAGKVRRIAHVPGPLAIAGARLLGAVLRHPPITVDQVMGFLQDTVADIGPACRDLGFTPRGVEPGLAVLFNRQPVARW